MASGTLAMSGRERERLVVIAQVCGKVLGQGAAGLAWDLRSAGEPRATQGWCRASAGGPRTVGSRRWLLGRLRHRTFYSLADVNAAIADLMTHLNEQRPIHSIPPLNPSPPLPPR